MSAPALTTKTCRSCGEDKSLTEFYRGARNADGLRWTCKTCDIAAAKAREARRRVEMGEEAWLERNRRIVAASRRRTGNKSGIAYMRARTRALQALADLHRKEFEHLLLLARRGEL